uniref:Lipoprotein n=1 Tax=Panagrellus redivivus TaxID=6233 RepID=A0A7E4V9R0_PANRE
MASFKKAFILGCLFALASAGIMKSLDSLPAPVSEHIADPLSEFESDCLCGEGDEGEEIETVTADGIVIREKRCGCGYGYCGCGAAPAPAAGGGNGTFIVIPAPVHPAPVLPAVDSQTSIDKLAKAISEMNTLAALQKLNAGNEKTINTISTSTGTNGSGVCDKLRLILSLTKQLDGFKLVEIAGQCVVQPE